MCVSIASQNALNWIKTHPAWIRICDLPCGYCETLYVQWHELSNSEKEYWGSEYAFDEFATKRLKVAKGFITDKNNFYSKITDVPWGEDLMTVFKIGKKAKTELQVA
ncbi:hypothetical protein ACQWTT_001196 [Acinetobacter baumannii]